MKPRGAAEGERGAEARFIGGLVHGDYDECLGLLQDAESDTVLADVLSSAARHVVDDAINSLGRYLNDTSRAAEARRLYEVALSAGWDVRLNLANLLAKDADQQARAQHLYEDLLAAGDTDALNNLAQLLTDQGDTRRVEELYEDGIRVDDTLAWRNYALFLIEEDRLPEAEATLSALAAAHPDAGQRPLADLYALTGRWAEAAPLYAAEYNRGASVPAAIFRAVRSREALSIDRVQRSLRKAHGSRVFEALRWRAGRSS